MLDAVPMGALCKTVSPAEGGGEGGAERMDEMHLSVFHSVSNRARRRRSSKSIWLYLPWCFGGHTQLAYSAYREDRLWLDGLRVSKFLANFQFWVVNHFR